MPPEPVELPPPGEGLASRAVARVLPRGEQLPPLARVGVAVLVLALLVGLALAFPPWGFIALGSATGLLVALGVPAALAGFRPLAALGRAALPLLLPLLVFAAAGVIKSPVGLQFAVGVVALLAAWFWLVKPDLSDIDEVRRRRDSRRTGLRAAAQVGLPFVVVVLIAIAFLLSSIVPVFGDSGETSRVLFVIAAACLAFAAVLRLVGYARTVFRLLVAVAISVLLWRVGIEVGLFPDRLIGGAGIGTLAAIAGGALVLTVVVEIVTSLLVRESADQSGVASDQLPAGMHAALFLETPVLARWVTDRLGLAGLAVSLLSAGCLLTAVVAASLAGGRQEDASKTTSAGPPPTAPSAMTDRALAATFSPVLTFTEDQRWTPIAVDDYVRGARIRDWEGRVSHAGKVTDLETGCPGVVNRPCYVMRQNCARRQSDADCAEDLPDEKAAYVRVARKKDWSHCTRAKACADGSPNPFAAAQGRYARDTDILVQYWYFYPFNEWVAPVVVGDLKEIHPADWEAVTIGLSSKRPLWTAYSAHCGGTYADWSQTPVAESDPRHLRPLVAVAVGSQANYRVAKASRVPNFAECSHVPKDLLTLVSYAANIRDRTDDHTVWQPNPGDLRLVTAQTPPMSFPGTWSTYTHMRLANLRKDKQLGKGGGGPASPPLQGLWQAPMRKIFGGGAWKEG